MWRAYSASRTLPPRLPQYQSLLDSGRIFFLRNLVLFELAFFIAYDNAMKMAPRSGAPFWLPDSVLLCALLLTPPRTWWIYLAAPLPLRLFITSPPSTPMWFLLAAFFNDSLKALVAAALLRRVLPKRGIRFDCLHEFWIYLAAAVVAAPALSGFAGAASWVALGREFWPTWRNWFLGDALANIVLTPLLLCLVTDWRVTAAGPASPECLAVLSGLILAVQAYQRGEQPENAGPYDYIPVAFRYWLRSVSVRPAQPVP
jgi:integral membrane sensor domain MASE1